MAHDRPKHDDIKKARTFFQSSGRVLIGAQNGWDTVALEFSDGLIVRLPRCHVAWNKMAKEASILARFGAAFSIEVPQTKLMFSPFQASYHQRIDGIPLTPKLYERMSPLARERLAGDLAEFIMQLQSLAVPVEDDGYRTGTLTPDIQARLEGYVSSGGEWDELRPWLTYTISELQAKGEHVNSLAFVHGDLHGGNVLMHAVDQNLVGIIDFLDAQYDDPARELSKCVKVSVALAKDVHRIYEARAARGIRLERVLLHAVIEQFTDMAELSLRPSLAIDRIALLRRLTTEIHKAGVS